MNYVGRLVRECSALGSTSLFFALIIALGFLVPTLSFKLFLGGFLLLGVILLFRMLLPTSRPKKNLSSSFLERIDAAGFPSAHASRIWLLTTLLWSFHTHIFYHAFLIILAIVISISRIYLKKHHLADVIGGTVIGIVTGLFIEHLF